MRDKTRRVRRKPHRMISGILKLDGMARIIAARILAETILTQYDGIIILKDGSAVEKGAFENWMEEKEDFRNFYKTAR